MIDWSLLRVFLAVAETGSLTAAAKRLRSSQPTVGRQVAALEATSGQKLFVRLPRGMTLTPTGEAIFAAAQQMQFAANSLERAIAGTEQEMAGAVRISVTEGVGVHWLPRAIAPFRRAHPEIALSVVVTNAASDLNRREADIAIRLFRMTAGEFVSKRLGRVAQGLYAARDYLARRGAPHGLNDLVRHDFVGLGEEDVDRFPQGVFLRQYAHARPYAFASNSLLAHYEAVRAGIGLGILTCFIADRDPTLVRLFPESVRLGSEAFAVVHADLRHAPRIKLVYDTIIELFARDRALFEALDPAPASIAS